MTAYYNENDPACVEVLRELQRAGVIADGDIDSRSIKEVQPDDLKGYTQCHFFAGAGVWSVSARLAGWPDDRELWTGSCPCQPFSQAGKRAGVDDPRHLWPDFYRLIGARRPAAVMGEQVAGKAGRDWFAGVRSDLETGGYAARAVDIPACAVGAPHIRNRIYWVAGRPVGLADAIGSGSDRRAGEPERRQEGRTVVGWPDAECAVVNATGVGRRQGFDAAKAMGHGSELAATNWPANYWSDAEWVICHDGKARRTKPGVCLLVNGLPGRIDLWRIAGNAIVPQVAAEVIAAFMETMP